MGAIYSEPLKSTVGTQTALTPNQLLLCQEIPSEVIRETTPSTTNQSNAKNTGCCNKTTNSRTESLTELPNNSELQKKDLPKCRLGRSQVKVGNDYDIKQKRDTTKKSSFSEFVHQSSNENTKPCQQNNLEKFRLRQTSSNEGENWSNCCCPYKRKSNPKVSANDNSDYKKSDAYVVTKEKVSHTKKDDKNSCEPPIRKASSAGNMLQEPLKQPKSLQTRICVQQKEAEPNLEHEKDSCKCSAKPKTKLIKREEMLPQCNSSSNHIDISKSTEQGKVLSYDNANQCKPSKLEKRSFEEQSTPEKSNVIIVISKAEEEPKEIVTDNRIQLCKTEYEYQPPKRTMKQVVPRTIKEVEVQQKQQKHITNQHVISPADPDSKSYISMLLRTYNLIDKNESLKNESDVNILEMQLDSSSKKEECSLSEAAFYSIPDINSSTFFKMNSQESLQKLKKVEYKNQICKKTIQISNNFELECLIEHNRLRYLHNCPPLVLNPKLSKLATNWAQSISRSKTIRRDDKNKYGENMYISVNMTINGTIPVMSWYNEIIKYNFGHPCFHPNTGHFTQVIWKETKEIGVGVVTKNKSTWVVVYYNPPGNLLKKFELNVPPLVK